MRTTPILFVISILSVPQIQARNFNTQARSYSIFDSVLQSAYQISSFVQDALNVVLTQTQTVSNATEDAPEDAYLNITQLATKYGYPIEEHTVTTEDGYIINVHRIPRGRHNVTNNVVVFLMHGLVESSESWILQGPDKALGYILADQGFDVWMGNARGNKYAKKHLTLQPNQQDFWDFTWEEIGIYDLPAMIDYALHVTNRDSLYYVGYSQGTTSFYVMNSLKPEYNKKIKMMFALAPVAFMANVRSPLIKMFSPASESLAYLLLNYNASSTDYLTSMTGKFCSNMSLTCNIILHMIVGHDSKHLSALMPLLLGHMPTSCSTLQLVHYGQLVQSGRFCQFDYGAQMNLEMYGKDSPPDYDLSKATVPNVVFFSEHDWVATPADVKRLLTRLPNVYDSNFIADFNHLDLMYAPVANDIIYSKIVKYIYDFEYNTILGVY